MMKCPEWIVEIEKMKAQRDDARAHNNILVDQVTEAEMQAAWCKEQLAAAVAALKAVEWVDHDDGDGDPIPICPWCGAVQWHDGHYDGCQREAAIKTVGGE